MNTCKWRGSCCPLLHRKQMRSLGEQNHRIHVIQRCRKEKTAARGPSVLSSCMPLTLELTLAVLLRAPHVQEHKCRQAWQQRGPVGRSHPVQEPPAVELLVRHQREVGVAPAAQRGNVCGGCGCQGCWGRGSTHFMRRHSASTAVVGKCQCAFLARCKETQPGAAALALHKPPRPHLYCRRSRCGACPRAASRTNSGRSRP